MYGEPSFSFCQWFPNLNIISDLESANRLWNFIRTACLRLLIIRCYIIFFYTLTLLFIYLASRKALFGLLIVTLSFFMLFPPTFLLMVENYHISSLILKFYHLLFYQAALFLSNLLLSALVCKGHLLNNVADSLTRTFLIALITSVFSRLLMS